MGRLALIFFKKKKARERKRTLLRKTARERTQALFHPDESSGCVVGSRGKVDGKTLAGLRAVARQKKGDTLVGEMDEGKKKEGEWSKRRKQQKQTRKETLEVPGKDVLLMIGGSG